MRAKQVGKAEGSSELSVASCPEVATNVFCLFKNRKVYFLPEKKSLHACGSFGSQGATREEQ